jgi:sporulation-control protein spo0M
MIDADTDEGVPPHVYELLADLIDFECLRSAVYDSDEEILTVETLPEMSARDTRRLYSTIEDAGFELDQLDHLLDGYSIDFKLG